MTDQPLQGSAPEPTTPELDAEATVGSMADAEATPSEASSPQEPSQPTADGDPASTPLEAELVSSDPDAAPESTEPEPDVGPTAAVAGRPDAGSEPTTAGAEPPEAVSVPTEPEAEAVEAIAVEAEAELGAGTVERTETAASRPAEEPVPTEPEPTITAGRYVADSLRAAGVKVAFTVPGESFLGLLDALGDAGIKVVAARHEGAAAFMAEASAQLTGRPAAVMGTRAVGAANMAIGLHTARQDSSPVIVIVGQVERSRRGREAFQEVDQVETFGRLAKWAVEVDRVGALRDAMDEALRRALSGRPGPVLVSLPADLLDERMIDFAPAIVRRSTASPPDADEIRSILHLLADAERPVILAGGGVLRARATSDLVRLAEIMEIPVVAGWRRPDVFPNDHRLYLGMTGYGSPPSVRQRLLEADAMLVIGCRLSEIASFDYTIPVAGARWAHVDLEPRRAHAGLSAPDIAVAADSRTFLRAARERLAGAVHVAASFDRRRAANEADRTAWEQATAVDETPWDGPGVHPGHVIATLGSVLPSEAILTTDAGDFSRWAARSYRFRRPGTFVGPTSGAMGYGLPAAIGAALVHRDRPVVALAGDGGFAMTMAELETAVRERLRVIAIVFDNERYGTIHAHQVARGTGVGVATDLGPIDFAAVAIALGACGVLVSEDGAFEPALREALVADRPTVIQVAVDRRWISATELPSGS